MGVKTKERIINLSTEKIIDLKLNETEEKVVEPEKKEKQKIKLTNISEAMDYLIFEVNDITKFKLIFKDNCPEFVKHFRKKGSVVNVVLKYIDLTKDLDTSEQQLINMSKTISYIVNSSVLKVNLLEKKEILNTINKVKCSLKKDKYSRASRKRINKYLDLLKHEINKFYPYDLLKNINYKYGINPNFNNQVLKQVQNTINDENKIYVDLRDKYIFTLDSFKNCNYEDALSFECLENGNYLLGVYIVDIYSYLKPNSILELEALNRGQTIYLPGLNIPMFPNSFNNQIILKKGKSKYVIANLFEFSSTYELVNFDIKRALITVADNKVNKKVENDLLKGKTFLEQDLFEKLLLLVDKISSQHPSIQTYHNIKETSKLYYKKQSQIIEYLMIYTNFQSALKYSKTEYPFLYRVNINNNTYYNNLKIDKTNKEIEKIINRLMEIPNKSFYSTENKGHHGLNLKMYAHTTTPLRNFASLENQKLIQDIIIDKKTFPDKEVYQLEDRLKLISELLNEKAKIIQGYSEEYLYQKQKGKRI